MPANIITVLTGQVVSFRGNPRTDEPGLANQDALVHHKKGAVVIDDKKIVWVGDLSELPKQFASADMFNHGDKLIMAGFIDAHLHFPQYRMLAAYAENLLEWLNTYTFIEEQRYGDATLAQIAATAFLDELIRNGTTSCLAFSTIHPEALNALFTAASKQAMCVISGKTMMDRNAPSGLRDTAQSAYDNSQTLIKKWHGKSRLGYAISPRFAVTSTEAQLEITGQLMKEHPDLIMQTHLSENDGEIAAVAADFPWSKDYTDVYDRYGILGERSFFAHGIHLSDRELTRLAQTGSKIVHCPTSNNFLGSGMMRVKHTQAHNVDVGLGSDIGGGTSYSMLQTMRDAYTVSQHTKGRLTAFDAFYMASLGNAQLLGRSFEIGSLEPGKYADIIVLDPEATPIMKERNALSQSLHDVLFALLIMGDDRAVSQTWVAGQKVKG